MNKKLMAKILIFAFLVVFLAPLLTIHPSAVTTYELDANNSDPQNLYYKLDDTELTAEVYIPVDIKSGFSLTAVIIPDSVKKGDKIYTVSGIGDEAFAVLGNLKSIVVPASITYIGDVAFDRCSSLESITLPEGLTSIGNHAFSYCSSLKTIAIPDSLVDINKSTFTFCTGLTGFNVGTGNNNFSSADGVLFNKDKTVLLIYPTAKTSSSYSVPDGVKTISEGAFRDCTNLSDITIPSTVTSIGRYAFENTAWLNNKADGIVYIGNAVYMYKGTMTNETDLVLPDNITCIADYAFNKCKKLLTVTISQNVVNIGSGTFLYCSKLTAINVSANNPNYSSVNGVLFNKNKTSLIQYPVGSTATEYAVPAGVKSIDYKAFYYCSVLTKITLPDSLEAIGENAFEGCTGITEIVIPENTASIDSYAFYYCTGLIGITIPRSVTAIGSEVFNKCDNIVLQIYKDSYAYEYAVKNSLKYKLFADYTINFENGFANGITDKQTAGNIIKKLGGSAVVKDPSGNAVSADTIVGTGFIIKSDSIDFYVVIKGDINGDGVIDSVDYLMIKKIILGNLNVSKVQQKAACISNTDQPDSVDALKVKKHIIGNYNLYTGQ